MESFEKEAISVNVGQRLAQLREERGLSVRALARLSGLSANAISMIERGRTSPSVSTLYRLADAIGIPVTAFFRPELQRQKIVFRKAAERTRLPFARGLWEGLGGEMFAGSLEPFMLTLESGASSGPYGMIHSGHEFVLCLRGQLEYHVEAERFLLEPGDSLLFAAQLRHRWRNPGNTVTNAVILIAGFQTGERPGEFHLAASQQ